MWTLNGRILSQFHHRRTLATTLLTKEECDQWLEKMHTPTLNILNSAQKAYSYRVGLADISPATFRSVLSHPALPGIKETVESLPHSYTDEHEKLASLGGRILQYFVPEYVRARFPRLPREAHELACQVYQASSNLSVVARSTGIEYAIIPFRGIPLIRHSTLKEYLPKRHDEEDGESTTQPKPNILPREIYAGIFKAAVAAALQEKGAWTARCLLDGLLFSASINRNLLYRPRNPMLQLARALNKLQMSSPDYRLLHESGRLSDQAMYVVGVYCGVRKLAEAHGPSLIFAQERAALQALRDLYLEDTPNAPRPSDILGKDGAPLIHTLSELVQYVDETLKGNK